MTHERTQVSQWTQRSGDPLHRHVAVIPGLSGTTWWQECRRATSVLSDRCSGKQAETRDEATAPV